MITHSMRSGHKVICTAPKGGWRKTPAGKFRVLLKSWLNVPGPRVPGPGKDEVCTIAAVRWDGYLALAGYEAHGWYDWGWFRPLETLEHEIAEIERVAKEHELANPVEL